MVGVSDSRKTRHLIANGSSWKDTSRKAVLGWEGGERHWMSRTDNWRWRERDELGRYVGQHDHVAMEEGTHRWRERLNQGRWVDAISHEGGAWTSHGQWETGEIIALQA